MAENEDVQIDQIATATVITSLSKTLGIDDAGNTVLFPLSLLTRNNIGQFKTTDATPPTPLLYQNYELIGTGVGQPPSGTYTNLHGLGGSAIVIPTAATGRAIINARAVWNGSYWMPNYQDILIADVSGKEDSTNKATDLSVVNNVKYPTTQAVSTALGLKENSANKSTSLATPDDTKFPTTKAVSDALGLKESTANKATTLTTPDNTKYPTTQAVATGLGLKENSANKSTSLSTPDDTKFPTTKAVADANAQMVSDTNDKLYIKQTIPFIPNGYINSSGTITTTGSSIYGYYLFAAKPGDAVKIMNIKKVSAVTGYHIVALDVSNAVLGGVTIASAPASGGTISYIAPAGTVQFGIFRQLDAINTSDVYIVNISMLKTAIDANATAIATVDNGVYFPKSKNDFTTNGYINSTGGITAVGANTYQYIFLPCQAGDKVKVVNAYKVGAITAYIICWYDASNNILGGIQLSDIASGLTYVSVAPVGSVKLGLFYGKQATYTHDIYLYGFQAYLNSNYPTFAVFGDSTSQGLHSSALINILPFSFLYGVGGSTVLETAVAYGAIDFIIKPFTIPADLTPVQIEMTPSVLFKTNYGSDGFITSYQAITKAYNTYAIVKDTATYTNMEVAGVIGTITTDANNVPYFTRNVAGSAVVVPYPIGTRLGDYSHQKRIPIILMGTNGPWYAYDNDYNLWPDAATINSHLVNAGEVEATNLFKAHKLMVDAAQTNGKFLIIGAYTPTRPDAPFFEIYEKMMKKEYGHRFFSSRKFLKDTGWQEAKLTLSSTLYSGTSDYTRIAAGKVPLSFFGDGTDPNQVHLNVLGNQVLANEVMRRLYQLGYIDKLTLFSF